MLWKESEHRTWALSGPNARDWPSRNACLRSGRLLHPRSLGTRGPIPADLGVKGLPWSIDFGSPKIGSDVRFRNGADSHEAAAKESTYA
jgi:hypothetical protein